MRGYRPSICISRSAALSALPTVLRLCRTFIFGLRRATPRTSQQALGCDAVSPRVVKAPPCLSAPPRVALSLTSEQWTPFARSVGVARARPISRRVRSHRRLYASTHSVWRPHRPGGRWCRFAGAGGGSLD